MAILDQLRASLVRPVKRVQQIGEMGTAMQAVSPEEAEPGAGIAIHVVEENGHVFETDDGMQIWCEGYAPADEDGLFLGEAEHRTSDPRVFYCHVAGVSYRPEALADSRFAHGSPVRLVAEPENQHDSGAIGIWDASGKIQAGYVPKSLSGEIAELMRSGTVLVGRVLREFRLGSASGKRLGIHIVIYPAGRISYIVHDDDDWRSLGNSPATF